MRFLTTCYRNKRGKCSTVPLIPFRTQCCIFIITQYLITTYNIHLSLSTVILFFKKDLDIFKVFDRPHHTSRIHSLAASLMYLQDTNYLQKWFSILDSYFWVCFIKMYNSFIKQSWVWFICITVRNLLRKRLI